jgi:predicted DNA-binding protein YlxM (UPF0122 family)
MRIILLAAHDGNDVGKIMSFVFTQDEILKIGRRLIVADYVQGELSFNEIVKDLKVGKNTVNLMIKKLVIDTSAYKLIKAREKRVEEEYKDKAYRKVGSPKLFHKKKEYTGYKRSDVSR